MTAPVKVRKKLIEVALPLEAINKAAARVQIRSFSCAQGNRRERSRAIAPSKDFLAIPTG